MEQVLMRNGVHVLRSQRPRSGSRTSQRSARRTQTVTTCTWSTTMLRRGGCRSVWRSGRTCLLAARASSTWYVRSGFRFSQAGHCNLLVDMNLLGLTTWLHTPRVVPARGCTNLHVHLCNPEIQRQHPGAESWLCVIAAQVSTGYRAEIAATQKIPTSKVLTYTQVRKMRAV